MVQQLPTGPNGVPKPQHLVDSEAQFVAFLKQRGMAGVPVLDGRMHPADGELAGWRYQFRISDGDRPHGLLVSPCREMEDWFPKPTMAQGEIVPYWLPSAWYRFDDRYEIPEVQQPLLTGVGGLDKRKSRGVVKARVLAVPTALRRTYLPHEFGGIKRLRLDIRTMGGAWFADLTLPPSHRGFRLPPCRLWTDTAVILHLRREVMLHQSAGSADHYRISAIESGANVAVRKA